MIPNIMSNTELLALLKPNETVDHKGIFIAKGIAERTVWDKHAVDNPTHAVISAPNEATARQKSESQIEDIRRHIQSTDVLLDFGSGYGRVAKYLLPKMPLEGYIGFDSSCENAHNFQRPLCAK